MSEYIKKYELKPEVVAVFIQKVKDDYPEDPKIASDFKDIYEKLSPDAEFRFVEVLNEALKRNPDKSSLSLLVNSNEIIGNPHSIRDCC